jgi:hypothetical protein
MSRSLADPLDTIVAPSWRRLEAQSVGAAARCHPVSGKDVSHRVAAGRWLAASPVSDGSVRGRWAVVSAVWEIGGMRLRPRVARQRRAKWGFVNRRSHHRRHPMNHMILSGRPVADPDTGTSQNGKPYARFRLAHDRRNGAQDDEREALLINCVAFDGLAASIVGRYVRKGQKLTVAGRLEPDNYDGDDTKYRSFTLVVDDVVLPDRQRSDTNPEEAPAF